MTKTQFLAQTYSKNNHVPSVDLGAFDISVDPKKKRVDLLTRVHLTPQAGAQLQLDKFAKRFSKLVPEVWDKKAAFHCTRNGWDDVRLDLRVKVVTSGIANAHYHIEVQDETSDQHVQGPFAMVTPEKYTGPGATGGFTPRTGEFGSAATEKREMKHYRTNIIWDLSKQPLVVPIKNSPLQDPIGRQRLEKFAREIMAFKVPRKFRSSRRPTLTITGCGSGDRAAMARRAATYLQAFGVKNPINTVATGDTTQPDGVALSFDKTELQNMFPEKPGSSKSLFRQITVAHEYGHMLGLPDEYLCMHALTKDAMENIFALTAPEVTTFKGSGNQIADVKVLPDGTKNVPHIVRHQGAFVRLCERAKVVPPEFGRMTSSLMSNGMVFHPYHFATIWEAICEVTGFDDWRIALAR